MRNFFMQNGDRFSLTNSDAIKVHQTLPLGVYDVRFDPMAGYFLQPKPDVRPLPPKLFGTIEMRAQRIAQTYADRLSRGLSTGVLLAGEKGSGKTLLARKLMDVVPVPTVVIGAPFCDMMFMELVVAGGPKLLLFDEFEKTYDKEKQTVLLSMLDGHHNNQNLIVATLNDTYAVIDPMKNRPSRFFYYYRYTGIEAGFIAEYCVERLNDPTSARIRDVQATASKVSMFNFDMLQSLVEEMNRYGDTADECMRHMNITDRGMGLNYSVKLLQRISSGENVEPDVDSIKVSNSYDLDRINFYIPLKTVFKINPKNDDDNVLTQVYFAASHLKLENGREMIFENPSIDLRCTISPVFKNVNWAL